MSEITPNHQPTISADDVDEMINPFRPLHQSMVPSAEELTSFPPFPPHVPTELESVLNDLTSPWAIRNSTPRIPGEAQVDFPRRIWRRWTVVLSSQLHIIALRQSIALAQRLILHQYIGSSDPVAARVHDFCASNPWTINLETEMSHNGTMARIASQRPNDIFLSFSVSSSQCRNRNPDSKLMGSTSIKLPIQLSKSNVIPAKQMKCTTNDISCCLLSRSLMRSITVFFVLSKKAGVRRMGSKRFQI
jgi:hypothetical protein